MSDAEQVVFKEWVDTSHPYFEQAIEIYVDSFPASERHPVETIRRRVEDGKSKLQVGILRGEVIFIALLWPLHATRFILLDYLATKAGHRSRGIAAKFFDELTLSLSMQSKYLLLETEDPSYGNNQGERAQRIAFYYRIGASRLEGVRFILPALQGEIHTDMLLMVYPGYEANELPAAIVRALISQVYIELYGRVASAELLAYMVPPLADNILLK